MITFPSAQKFVECKEFSPDKHCMLQEVLDESHLAFRTSKVEAYNNSLSEHLVL
jgi:hypothetical protein